MIDVKVETIDQAKALEYLAKNKGNRPYTQPYTSLLASKQARGEWQPNGDSIRFDSNGDLRDGQHRLEMVRQTGKPIEVVVVRGIDPGAFVTMDTGKSRGLGDVLSIKGEVNHRSLAGSLRWVRRYLTNNMRGGTVSHEQHFITLDEHPGIRDSVTFCLNFGKPAGYPSQPGITAAIHYLCSRINPDKANDFTERFITGLRIVNADDPVGRLRGQINDIPKSHRTVAPDQVFAIFSFAWNIYQAGAPAKQNFRVRASQRARPKLDGFPKDLFLEGQLPLEENNSENET